MPHGSLRNVNQLSLGQRFLLSFLSTFIPALLLYIGHGLITHDWQLWIFKQ